MNFTTHKVAGMLAAEMTLVWFQKSTPLPLLTAVIVYPVAIAGAQLFSMLSDVDKKESHVGEKLFPISFLLERLGVRHRTLTHSATLLAVLWYFTLPLHKTPWMSALIWSWLMAYASHPFIDLFNPHGVELLWPIPIKFRLLPESLAISVEQPESFGEKVFRMVCSLISFYYLAALMLPLLTQLPLIGPIVGTILSNISSVVPGIASI